MIKHPTSGQLESVDYIFNTNNPHISNVLDILESELQEHLNLVIAPHTEALQMARHAGAVSSLKDLLELFRKK